MNIFVLDLDPVRAAVQQCDKHIVKMPLESAQMLSTAHRYLDGTMYVGKSASGRAMKLWRHPSPDLDSKLYKVVHLNHPCSLWTMGSRANYLWHYQHFVALSNEFTHRYGKVHASFAMLKDMLANPPANIPDIGLTQFRLAMGAAPQCMHPDDPVRSYREFYQTKQDRFSMTWTKRATPSWFKVNADVAA